MLTAYYNPEPNQKYIVTFDYVGEFIFDTCGEAQDFIRTALLHSKHDILRAKIDIARPKEAPKEAAPAPESEAE